MKKYFTSLSLFAAVVSLTACQDVEISNGRIPQNYVKAASALEGTYSGTISSSDPQAGQKQNAILRVQIINQSPVLTTSVDFLGAGCGSRIGRLQRVSVDGNGNLSRAVFAFSGGRCAADDHIVLNLRGSVGHVKISAFVIQKYETHNGDSQRIAPTVIQRVGRFAAN